LVALVSGCLVYVASFDKGYFIKNKVVLTMASYVGERSYSMYLTHMISLVLTKELSYRYLGSIPKEGYTPIFIALVVLVITFIFSEFSYQFIEKPARNYGSQLASAKEKMLDITKGNN
jgi:peptidoglycan/LPS O-acetylase OafA/YrhL